MNPYREHTPNHARCLLEVVDIAAVGIDVLLPWGTDV
jgi:hypothetical protein